MSDGREEREESERRIEQEKREDREDQIDRVDLDEWKPERVDSSSSEVLRRPRPSACPGLLNTSAR